MCRLVAIFALMLSGCLACARQHPCTTVEGQRAETQTDTLRSWDVLYGSYKLYRHYDDGARAEGYSEAVARILVDHWSTLPRLASLAKNDSYFRRFILKHIDATLDIDDIKKIKTNAKTRCPSELRAICADLRRFTRLTNAFSKKFENHCHMVAIYHAYYNFCRVHQTLRVTPAMEAGLTDHVWSLEELVGLLEQKNAEAAA